MRAQECGFETPQNYQTFDTNSYGLPTSTTPNFCINVAFRIVRNNDGSNAAVDPSIIPQVFAQLNAVYNPHGISFVQIGTFDYVNNSAYNSYTSTPSTSPTNIPNCLNVYFIKNFQNLSPTVGGIASFGTNRSVIRGSVALDNYNVAHEIGHNLNLLHTFQCTSLPIQTCTENPLDTSHCLDKGDKVCDTPTDFNPYQYNSSTPPPYPINNYNPDKSNIMSYWFTKTSFTSGQAERIKNTLLNSPQLQSIRSNQCAKIEGESNICSIGNYNYSVVTFGTNPTITWSVSSNLSFVGSNSGNAVTIKSSNANNSGSATITVSINGFSIQRIIHIGAPSLGTNNKVMGIYDWVSVGYSNMGLIAPNNPTIESYRWEIIEGDDFPPNCPTANSTKPKFIGAPVSDPYNYNSGSSNQAVVNWGTCSGSYMIVCYAVNSCGETPYLERYVDVGLPKNNPCYKNNFNTIIAPNPIRGSEINIVVNKTPQQTPCNWKTQNSFVTFNAKLDQTNNTVSIYDFNGNLIYNSRYDSDEFTISNLSLISNNNYIVNLITNEGGVDQKIIIVE
ncbi:M43 family zinc metalloprotease [Flavobacterium sp.]|uniref:M43 family zinc metalloprotease n=1 Tax=Flavobacterium sp. TaxID=239 RepID=UPI00260B4CB4|nr:M43 family zinc metalloprotease [Flavobacterium sp.]